MSDTTSYTDCQGVSDADLRWALRALERIASEGGPALLRDCVDAAVAAAHQHRDLTLGQNLALPELSRRLMRMFGVQRDRADRLAREHLIGSRRAAVIEVIRRYLDLVDEEAERRREREARMASADEPPLLTNRERAIAAERRRRDRRASA